MAHHSVSDLDSHRAPFGYARALGDYVMASPSSYHAVAAAAELLRGAGFTELHGSEAWSDVVGRHFTIRDGALIAWVAPRDYRAGAGSRILGAHTDSPGFKLKPKPTTVSNGWYQAGVEVYGGVLLNSWLDRDLRLAGRIVVRGENGELTQHLCATEAIARIPQLAIHLDRGANDGLKLDKQQHVQPIWGTGSAQDADVLGLLADMAEASVSPEDIVGFDIVLADTQKPELIGQRRQLLASGRLDNLSSVYAGLHAFVEHAEELESASQVSMLAAFDHEEVGSATRSGAAGPFLEDVLVRISAAQGESQDDYRRSLAESVCLSADAGHLVHPNYRG
ncbi:MAG: M18 family aminopeptidase, partial [Kocuria rhizophila]